MAAQISAGARRFVLISALFLIVWQIGSIGGLPRRFAVNVALYGFVFHMLFGKAYSLIPSYFDRQLRLPWAPQVHLPVAAIGACLLAIGSLPGIPSEFSTVGSILWSLGVVIFIAAMGLTLRDNITGRETGTSSANEDRQAIDRFANAFIPIAFGYLLFGTYELAASHTRLPVILTGYAPQSSHLLGAGTAVLLIFAIGFRLLPRFLVAYPPRVLVGLILPFGAVGPLLLATSIPSGRWLLVGALLEALAVVGFAAVYLLMLYSSDRNRVGFYGPLAGAVFGVLAVGLGVSFAVNGADQRLVLLHFRLNLLGFVGLTIIGIAYQFYPPGVGTLWGVGDRSALVSISAIVLGLSLETIGRLSLVWIDLFLGQEFVVFGGQLLVLFGVIIYGYLITALFYERYWT